MRGINEVRNAVESFLEICLQTPLAATSGRLLLLLVQVRCLFSL